MTAVVGNVAADHPAKWSTPVLEALADIVEAASARMGLQLGVLDPFAGIGRLRLYQALAPSARHVVGVELQPEWCPEGTEVGNALDLQFSDGFFDAVVTSPCYGNRMADHHHARDRCGACKGQGVVDLVVAADLSTDALQAGATAEGKRCPTCKGSGLSWRNTYAHALRRHGAEVARGSAAVLAWGPEYRAFHRQALAEMVRVVVPGGLLAINMSNHPVTEVKGGPQVEQLVVEWWTNEVLVAGCKLWEVRRVQTRRNRFGANGHAKDGGADPRVDGEVVIVAHTPNPRRNQGRLL